MPHNFHASDEVRLNPEMNYFTYGRGRVSFDEIGTIIRLDNDEVIIDFPSHGTWGGLVTEIVHANSKQYSKYKKNLEGIINLKPVSRIFN